MSELPSPHTWKAPETHDPLPEEAARVARLIAEARADERENGHWVLAYRDALMGRLRAQVEALPVQWKTLGAEWIRRDDVLALLDGRESDAG